MKHAVCLLWERTSGPGCADAEECSAEGELVRSDCYLVFWRRVSLPRVWQSLLDNCSPWLHSHGPGHDCHAATSGVFRAQADLPHAVGPRWSYEWGFRGTRFQVQIWSPPFSIYQFIDHAQTPESSPNLCFFFFVGSCLVSKSCLTLLQPHGP